VVILGLLLAAAGWAFGVQALQIVGVMVVICGLILLFLGADRTGGHRWW
jgi:sulfite exporter TauE/SafE